MKVSRFNIRVYGILLHAGCVLISHELIKNVPVAKFPGGGLVPGEGTLECLQREILEEMGMEAKEFRHFYTTDFFQPSAFSEEDQIVSIYYTFQVDDPGSIKDGAPARGAGAEQGQHFRWLPLEHAKEGDVDLPIDRRVMKLLTGSKRP